MHTELEHRLANFRSSYLQHFVDILERPIVIESQSFWNVDAVYFSNYQYGEQGPFRLYHSAMIGAAAKLWVAHTIGLIDEGREVVPLSIAKVDDIDAFVREATHYAPVLPRRHRALLDYMCATCIDFINGNFTMEEAFAVRCVDPNEFEETLQYVTSAFHDFRKVLRHEIPKH